MRRSGSWPRCSGGPRSAGDRSARPRHRLTNRRSGPVGRYARGPVKSAASRCAISTDPPMKRRSSDWSRIFQPPVDARIDSTCKQRQSVGRHEEERVQVEQERPSCRERRRGVRRAMSRTRSDRGRRASGAVHGASSGKRECEPFEFVACRFVLSRTIPPFVMGPSPSVSHRSPSKFQTQRPTWKKGAVSTPTSRPAIRECRPGPARRTGRRCRGICPATTSFRSTRPPTRVLASTTMTSRPRAVETSRGRQPGQSGSEDDDVCGEDHSRFVVHRPSEGRRGVPVRLRSKAAPARSTSASAPCRPMICMLTGRPSGVKPHGTASAGRPTLLGGSVNRE